MIKSLNRRILFENLHKPKIYSIEHLSLKGVEMLSELNTTDKRNSILERGNSGKRVSRGRITSLENLDQNIKEIEGSDRNSLFF